MGTEPEPLIESTSTPPTTFDQLSNEFQDQKSRILDAVKAKDVAELQRLSMEPGGFLDDSTRTLVWPILLQVDSTNPQETQQEIQRVTQRDNQQEAQTDTLEQEEPKIKPHKDESQVHLDVIRSFINYPEDISDAERDALREDLEEVIVSVLRSHPTLSYFQGYHDIVSVLMLTFNDLELTKAAATKMSLHRIRDNMSTNLDPVLGYLRLLQRILAKEDAHLASIVAYTAALPYFSLSWILTLLSHDITSLSLISRIFDFLLPYNPAMVSYLGVSLVLLKKEQLGLMDLEDMSDPAILHHALSQLPQLKEMGPPQFNEYGDSFSDNDFATPRNSGLEDSLVSSAFETNSSPPSQLFSDSATEDLPSPPSENSEDSRDLDKNECHEDEFISVEVLIKRTYELYKQYPLLGDNGINADEIMGPKSCIFTYPLSTENRLSDAQAGEIIGRGEDIVLPEPVEAEPKADPPLPVAKKPNPLYRIMRSSAGNKQFALAIIGVGVLLLAVYGQNRTFKEKLLGLKNWWGWYM